MPLDRAGHELTPRVNQLDLSFSKRDHVRGVKFDPKIDIFNALNSDDYFTVRTTAFARRPANGRRLERHLHAAGQHSAGPAACGSAGGELVETGTEN